MTLAKEDAGGRLMSSAQAGLWSCCDLFLLWSSGAGGGCLTGRGVAFAPLLCGEGERIR